MPDRPLPRQDRNRALHRELFSRAHEARAWIDGLRALAERAAGGRLGAG